MSVEQVKSFTGCTASMSSFGVNNLEAMLLSLIMAEITDIKKVWTGAVDKYIDTLLAPVAAKPRAKPAAKQTPYDILINGPVAAADPKAKSATKTVKPLRFSVAFLSQLEFINRCLAADFDETGEYSAKTLHDVVLNTKPNSPSLLLCKLVNNIYKETLPDPEVFIENMTPFLAEVKLAEHAKNFCTMMFALLTDLSEYLSPLIWSKLNTGVTIQISEDHFNTYLVSRLHLKIPSAMITLIDDYTHDLKVLNAKPPKTTKAASATSATSATTSSSSTSGLPILLPPQAPVWSSQQALSTPTFTSWSLPPATRGGLPALPPATTPLASALPTLPATTSVSNYSISQPNLTKSASDSAIAGDQMNVMRSKSAFSLFGDDDVDMHDAYADSM